MALAVISLSILCCLLLMKKVLIFEPFTAGHRKNFLDWLLEGIRRETGTVRFVLVSARTFSGANEENLEFDPIPDEESHRLSRLPWWEKRRACYRLLQSVCRTHCPDEVLLMELTPCEWHLLLFGCSVPVSAIAFVQPPEIHTAWKRQFKITFTRMLAWRVDLRTLYYLNGNRAADHMNRLFRGRTQALPLPDPAVPMTREAGPPEPASGRSNLRFLFFGAISSRKGVGVLFQALELLDAEFADQAIFLFRGKPETPDEFEQAWKQLQARRPDLRLDLQMEYLSDRDMIRVFDECDVVLMPYLRPEYSSGVLPIAAGRLRMVLGPEGGLLGRLIQANALGMTVPITPSHLKEALSRIIRGERMFDPERALQFYESSSPEEFAQQLLNPLKQGGSSHG